MVHELAEDVARKDMGLLNPCRRAAFHHESNIHEAAETTSVPARESDSVQPLTACCFDRGNNVWGISTGADGQENIPFHGNRLNLLGKDVFKRIVVSDARNDGGIRRQSDSREGRALKQEAVYKFSGNMLRISRASAVAADEELSIAGKRLSYPFREEDQAAAILLHEVFFRLNALPKRLVYDFFHGPFPLGKLGSREKARMPGSEELG